jgi:hypothetical protein
MKTVKCMNDKNLPLGANVTAGEVYEVENEYLNALDQRVYIIKGAPNEGTTKFGMRWIGYDALRFKEVSEVSEVKQEYAFALN